MPMLHYRPVLFATFSKSANGLQAALKPGVELAARDVDVQHFVSPVEVLECGHQWMFGYITCILPLLALARGVSHVLAFDFQTKHSILLQW